MIDFSCPRCGTEYHSDDTHLGCNVRCTRCGDVLEIRAHNDRPRRSSSQIEIPKKRNSRLHFLSSWTKSKRPSANRRPAMIAIALVAGVLLLMVFAILRHRIGTQAPLSTKQYRASETPSAPPKGFNEARPASEPVELSADEVGLPPDTQTSAVAPAPVPVRRKPSRHPADPEPIANSLPTGTRIMADENTNGRGEVLATNGTGRDACLVLIDTSTDRRVRKVWIRAGDSFLLDHLNPGSYNIVFATGRDWDDSNERFNRDAAYFAFGKTLQFQETRNGANIEYERHSITLNPVVGGNVPSRSISEAEFHAQSGKG